jgi:RNA polymerase sigma-70 factor (ECF subfamily)
MGKRGAEVPGRPSTESPPKGASGHPIVAAFNELRDELISTLCYLLGNRDDALDVAQETFLKCWRAKASTADVDNLRAWIFRVGLNAAKDLQRSAWNRRMKTTVAEESMIAAPESPLGRTLEDQETLSRLREAITELRQDEKEVFLLRQNGDLTYEQIAEIRRTPVGTVKTQMRAALIKLRKILVPAEQP